MTLNDILYILSSNTGRVEGGPKWAQSDRYDIIAKAGRDIPAPQRRQVILTLLEECFKLAIHQEARKSPGWHWA